MDDEIILQVFDQLPGYIGWKDTSLNHLGCNRNLALVLRLQDTSQIIGRKDHDLLDHTDESDLFHKKNDLLVLQGNIIKGIHKSADPYDGSLFFFVKKPIFDSANKISGLIYCCHEFTAPTTFADLFKVEVKHCPADFIPSHYIIDSSNNTFNLSNRELECIFFMLRGKNAKQISEVMTLSKRTVESYIENIKNKFGCHSKSELMVRALSMGYMNIIPASFLQNPPL